MFDSASYRAHTANLNVRILLGAFPVGITTSRTFFFRNPGTTCAYY
jgi:hypothetical protein